MSPVQSVTDVPVHSVDIRLDKWFRSDAFPKWGSVEARTGGHLAPQHVLHPIQRWRLNVALQFLDWRRGPLRPAEPVPLPLPAFARNRIALRVRRWAGCSSCIRKS